MPTACRRTVRWRRALAAAVAVLLAVAMAPALRETAAKQEEEEEKKKAMATAAIVFGDSIVDPGNNNDLFTLSKANHLPYGKDFAGHVPTGRFSNGLIPSDFLAQRLNLKQLLPPYLGVEHTPEDLLTGVSFASGGTGFDPLTPAIMSVFTMEQQLEYFDEYRAKLVSIAGEEGTKQIISGALFIVCSGTDDIANTYYTTPFRSLQYDVPSYVGLLLTSAEAFLSNVSARGAQRIGFVGLPPIGCLPCQRTFAGGLARSCVQERNRAARLYNSKAQELMARLQGKEPGVFPTLVYIDIYAVMQDLVDNGPAKYGFTETTRGCCGTGLLEATALCDERFVPVCDDVSERVFFDSFHPTERAYKIVVDYIFDRYIQFMLRL